MSFESDTLLMFERFDERIDTIRQNYMAEAARLVVVLTPGPGNQHPADTRYKAIGRLRDGWGYTISPPPSIATRWDGGEDLSNDGRQTSQRITAQIHASPLASVSYLTNDVAYGYIVHQGLGHHGHRPDKRWTLEVVGQAQSLLDRAVQDGGR